MTAAIKFYLRFRRSFFHRMIPVDLKGASSFCGLNSLCFISQARDFRKQIDLDLLNFDQPLPLVRQEVVDFVVQVPDFKFGL